MIELKNVFTSGKPDLQALSNYSLIVRKGEYRQLERSLGEAVINVVLGFTAVDGGFVCFDGMPLTANSAFFLRKMIAYVPLPEGFENVVDYGKKQVEMVEDAVKSDADIVLCVDPTSHQNDETARLIMASLRQKASKGSVVIVASDRNDL
jgi:ABC-type multidrug transport system fused ATPase/permease subunit